jgi:hypothetical protein
MAKNKGGRPTKYRAEYEEQVYKLCLLGATDEELADFFGVTVQTIHNWAAAHDGFFEARKNGKQVADAKVAEALYHRALGYEHDAVQIMTYEGESWEHAYRKRYPPDTAAAFIWLKNRQPDKWRDKHEVAHSVEPRSLTPEEKANRISDLLVTAMNRN